jgi:hypothetical protein
MIVAEEPHGGRPLYQLIDTEEIDEPVWVTADFDLRNPQHYWFLKVFPETSESAGLTGKRKRVDAVAGAGAGAGAGVGAVVFASE